MKIKTISLGGIRILVALVFVFSGFVKAVDPWGTALKLGEYFDAFGLDFLTGARYVLSILLSGAELFLGLCLLFRLGKRMTAGAVLLFIAFFTVLTLILAVWNPVEDCGCFGDAIKLTNWQTFYKNVILLGMALLVWMGMSPARQHWSRSMRIESRENRMIDASLAFCFALFSIGIGMYSLRHLPLIDFLPYRTGQSLIGYHHEADSTTPEGDIETWVVYRNRTTEETREIKLEEFMAFDTTGWEFVDTRILGDLDISAQNLQSDFAIFDGTGDVAPELLRASGPWFLITLTDLRYLDQDARADLSRLVSYTSKLNIPVYAVTPASLPESRTLTIANQEVPVYNMDATTLKTVIRTHKGLILFQNGTILGKWTCRDIPDFDLKDQYQTPLAWVAARVDRVNQTWLIGVMLFGLLLTYAVYFIHRYR